MTSYRDRHLAGHYTAIPAKPQPAPAPKEPGAGQHDKPAGPRKTPKEKVKQ